MLAQIFAALNRHGYPTQPSDIDDGGKELQLCSTNFLTQFLSALLALLIFSW